MAFANPLSPGGMSPKGVHLPTMAWAIILGAVAFVLYTQFIKK
jgi:hypothetical protein